MYQGTTPTLIITVHNAVLDGCTCYVTLKTRTGKLLTKSGSDLVVAGNQIAVFLTQEETLQMASGRCLIQVRWIDAHGEAMSSDVTWISVNDVLLKDVIEYEGTDTEGD